MEAAPILIEKLNNTVSQLPPERVQEVLDFAEYLLVKEAPISAVLSSEQRRALELIGMFNGPEDLAAKHDDYLVKFNAGERE